MYNDIGSAGKPSNIDWACKRVAKTLPSWTLS